MRLVIRMSMPWCGEFATSRPSTIQSVTSDPEPFSISMRLLWLFCGPGVFTTTVAPVSRARVLGATTVPELRIRQPAYVPDRTRIVSPGAMVSTACWRVRQGADDDPLKVSFPLVAT